MNTKPIGRTRTAALTLAVLAMMAGGFLLVLPGIPPAHAAPSTVATLGGNYFGATYNRPVCVSNGYTFVFYSSAGSGTVENYQSSPDGVTWSAPTSTGATVGYGALQFSAYCDSSANVYIAWSTGGATFDYRQGTTSGGVITWAFAAVAITCTHGTCGSAAINVYGYDTSHVGIVVSSNSGTFDENWLCTTTCSSNANWADKLADSTNNCAFGCEILGMDANNHWCSVEFTNPVSGKNTPAAQCTTNGGTSWTAVSTANNYGSIGGSCDSVSTTIMCGMTGYGYTSIYFITFVVGAGSWTETAELTGLTATATGVGIATDGNGNVYLTWQDSSTTAVDQIKSTNSGSTWSGVLTYASGEATALYAGGIAASLLFLSGQPSVCWLLQTSNNLRCGTSSTVTATTTATTTTTAVTTTTIISSTVCGGDCTPTGSGSWLPNGTEWASYTQNPVPQTATISNVTLKLAAAPATTSTTPVITVGVFVTCNPNYTPSPSNYLQTVDEVAFTLTNGTLTDGGFLHFPLNNLVVSTSGSCLASGAPITVCGYCYFGVGVISTNHASRGGGASGSGFKIQTANGGSAWWSWLPFFGLFGLAWDGSGSTLGSSYLGYAILTIAGQVVTIGGGTTTYTTVTNIITDVTSVVTTAVPVSGCFGCGSSFGQALTFAVMGLGVSQNVANWLLTFGCAILFAAIAGLFTKGDPSMIVLGGLSGLAIASGLGFLFWLYFALMMILPASFGVGKVLKVW